jgi:hypothetical protein
VAIYIIIYGGQAPKGGKPAPAKGKATGMDRLADHNAGKVTHAH